MINCNSHVSESITICKTYVRNDSFDEMNIKLRPDCYRLEIEIISIVSYRTVKIKARTLTHHLRPNLVLLST